MVQLLTHDPEIEGSIPAAGTGERIWQKAMFKKSFWNFSGSLVSLSVRPLGLTGKSSSNILG